MKIIKHIGIVTVLLTSSWALAQDPRFTKQPTNATVSLGATAQFVVTAYTASLPLTYQWYFKDAPLDAVANPSVVTKTLSLTNVTLAQEGPYFVVATNAVGGSATSQVAVLDVDPTFTKIMTGPGGTDSAGSVGAAWGDYD
jgi:type II secretory pathway component HofQ